MVKKQRRRRCSCFPWHQSRIYWKVMDLESEGVEGELYGLVMTYDMLMTFS